MPGKPGEIDQLALSTLQENPASRKWETSVSHNGEAVPERAHAQPAGLATQGAELCRLPMNYAARSKRRHG